jgi:hypothetical protein
MITPALALVLALAPSRAASVPAAVSAALDAALAVPGGRIVTHEYRAPGCEPRDASVPVAITASGRYAVKIAGAGCKGWAQVRVEVFAPTAISTRKLAAGESLANGVTVAERAVAPGRAAFVPAAGSTAARAIPAGRLITANDVASTGPALAAGATVRVVVRSGLVQLEQSGRYVPCGAGRGCAVLPSGKHVEGHLDGNVLVVEVP